MLAFYLVATILCFACLGLTIRFGCRRGGTPFDLCANIFTIAAVICGGAVFLRGPLLTSPSLVLWGIVAGVCGASGFLLFSYALEIGHYGYTLVIMNASFLVPVVFTLLFLGERFTPSVALGIPFVIIALYLISAHGSRLRPGRGVLQYAPTAWRAADAHHRRWLVFILSAFLVNGIHLIAQAMACRGGGDYLASYLFYLYLAGALFFLPGIMRRHSFALRLLAFGALGGVTSLGGIMFTQKALQLAPETIVFPVALSGPALVGVVLSRLLFKDRITPLGYAGVALGIIGIVVLAA